jgi:3-oxocholest-4-en-26-oyl-CoA dehydrogenase beta subunit
MDYSLNESQEILKKSTRDFLTRNCTEKFIRDMEANEKGYSPSLWKEMAQLGWLGMIYPEKYGGLGLSILDLAIIYEEMGRAMCPSPHLSTVVLCGLILLTAGTEEQKKEFLPKIAKGDLIFSLALTEPSISWEARGIQVSAVADEDSYIINGTKLFVHDANSADYLLCIARTKDKGKPERGISIFLVDTKSQGINFTPLTTTAHDKQSEVIFEHVRVPKNNLIGKLNAGWKHVEKVIQQGAVLLCAEMVGAGQRILELTVDEAKTRIRFELPIGINQHVQEHCVSLLSEVDGSRWVTYQAAWKLSKNLPCDMEVAIAKAWTSDAHERACWHAHQVFGAMGFDEEFVLSLYTRRAKAAQLYLGDSAYHLKKIAKQMDNWTLEMPRGKAMGLWDKEERLQPTVWNRQSSR